MKRCAIALVSVATSLAMPLLDESSASAGRFICGWYFGARVCTPILRTGPSKPTTSDGMIARATPKTVGVGEPVTLWMGPRPGKHGFDSREVVRYFDIYKGRTSEMTGVGETIKGGIARWKREWLSMPGVDPTGDHHLCAMGERTGRIACVKVVVAWTSSGTTTTVTTPAAPANTAAPSVSSSTSSTTSTTTGSFTPPKADDGFSVPKAG